MSKRKIDAPHWDHIQAKYLENPFRDVPLSTLNSYRGELHKLITAADREKLRLSAITALVDEAINQRDKVVRLHVIDHAIVRYLERFKGIDINEICREMVDRADAGEMEFAVREGMIITVLPQGVAAVGERNGDDE